MEGLKETLTELMSDAMRTRYTHSDPSLPQESDSRHPSTQHFGCDTALSRTDNPGILDARSSMMATSVSLSTFQLHPSQQPAVSERQHAVPSLSRPQFIHRTDTAYSWPSERLNKCSGTCRFGNFPFSGSIRGGDASSGCRKLYHRQPLPKLRAVTRPQDCFRILRALALPQTPQEDRTTG